MHASATSTAANPIDVVAPVAAIPRTAPASTLDGFAIKTLRASAVSWFVAAALGQLMFASYIAMLYGGAVLRGQLQDWNQVMPHGYVVGATFLNAVLGLHLLFAAFIVIGGLAQLVPAVRRRWPGLHRWTGRLYLIAAATLSIGGLVMVWGRGTVGDMAQHIAISLNAMLILLFAALAWRHARARRFDVHRRWALRLFLAVSGVWFFRIGLMLWIVLNQGPAGFDPESFTGPFLTFLAFAQYLLPLMVLELYFRAQMHGGAKLRLAASALLATLALMALAGAAAASALMWLPRM